MSAVLTARQQQVVALVAQGRTNEQIAAACGVGVTAVKQLLARIATNADVPLGESVRTRAALALVRAEQAHAARLTPYLAGGCLVFPDRQTALAALAPRPVEVR